MDFEIVVITRPDVRRWNAAAGASVGEHRGPATRFFDWTPAGGEGNDTRRDAVVVEGLRRA